MAQAGQLPDIWIPVLIDQIASFLPPNELACTLRQLNKATRLQFISVSAAKLSLPIPEHAFTARWGRPGALRSLSYEQRKKLVALVAASGSIPNLKVALKAIASTLTDEELEPEALPPGRIFPWMKDRGCHWIDEVLAAAAGAGQQAMIEWLLANGLLPDTQAVCSAAQSGHFSLMNWLLAQLPRHVIENSTSEIIRAGAFGLNVQQLKELCQDMVKVKAGRVHFICTFRPEESRAAAASSPTADWQAKLRLLEIVRLRHPSTEPCRAVAGAGPNVVDVVARLIWLRSRGYPVDSTALESAASAGNLDVLLHLLDQEQVKPDTSACVAQCAARHGHLHVLQALHNRDPALLGDPLETVGSALRSAELVTVEWLVATFGATPLELQRFMVSAPSGGMAAVQWLLSRGCLLEAGMISHAAESNGCEELLEWLVKRGCPLEDEENPYKGAISNGDVATLRCLHRLGLPMKEDHDLYTTAAKCGGRPLLRVLHSHLGYPFSATAKIFEQWDKDKGVPQSCLRWLVEEAGCPVDWKPPVDPQMMPVDRTSPGSSDALLQWDSLDEL